MCREILETLMTTEYNKSNVLTNEQSTLKMALSLTAFAKKYDLREDALSKIFDERLCIRNDNYCRTVNVEYESETLDRTMYILKNSSMSINQIEQERLTENLLAWDVPRVIGNYICNKYCEKLDNDDGSNTQYFRLRVQPASHIVAYKIVKDAFSASSGEHMQRSKILDDCMKIPCLGEAVTRDKWMNIIELFETVQNDVDEKESNECYVFNEDSVPLFTSTSILLHRIETLMSDDDS